MLDLDLMLKRNELCVVGMDPARDVTGQAGLYVRDTRFLSAFSVRLSEAKLQLLHVQAPAPDRAIITRTNPSRASSEGAPEAQTLLVRSEVTLDTSLVIATTVRNFGRTTMSQRVEVELASDFKDMFDVRGMPPKKRAVPLPAETRGDGEVELSARGSDGQSVTTRVDSTPAASIEPMTVADTSGATLSWPLVLAPGEATTFEVRIAPVPIGAPLVASASDDPSFAAHVKVRTPSEPFNAFISRCDADLALLQTTFPEGSVPAAGIPWYIAPFGRDSLIVALQTMHAYPARVASTLRLLASLQATEDDPWREAQPGKILHEMRYGDMARTGQVPHTPYYGSIDSTPLFVMTCAQHYLWHRDDALFDDLAENIRRALAWIEQHGDLDGDGLIEFSGRQQDTTHISQQGWKDSHDSLHFADGREIEGPIALVEVQGYVHAAYRWLAEAARLRGDATWADELAAKAEVVRVAVEDRFWLESAGYYAQALDGEKRPVDAISSNPGHLLFCGLPSAERAARAAERMARPDMSSGWGLRTLSAEMATYNPMSYHNGSIWPHDFSLAMVGLRDYGEDELAGELAMALLTLAEKASDLRLAELYCGFPPSDAVPTPVNYPVSCSPQAWAAASGLLAVRTLLGLKPDPEARTLTVEPHLPVDWSSLAVTGLHAYGAFVDIEVERSGGGYDVRIANGHA
jgi:glycogen debranching enzyme